jgi:RHS repeat-associated protein
VKKYYAFAGQTVAMKDADFATNGFKYFLSDHLGSVSLVLSSTGTILEQQRYLPFGQPRAMSPAITSTDFTYTGQRNLPDTGLMDYNARFYSPSLGRFIQPDTIIPSAANPQSWNRYSYVSNRPVNLNDPTGHSPNPPTDGRNYDACWIYDSYSGEYVRNHACSNFVFEVELSNQLTVPVTPFGSPFSFLTFATNQSKEDKEDDKGSGTPSSASSGVPPTPSSAPQDQDWSLTEEEFWQKRNQYINEVLEIPGRAFDKMRNEGYSFYEAAEWAVEERLAIGKKYKDLMPPVLQEETFARNMKEYGDPYGPPNGDWFRDNKNYSNYQIIKASGRPGGGNIIPKLLEIADRYWK